jgi:type I restriction enzyme, S subunit
VKFKRYPKYKPSVVEWVGEIPVGWNVQPFFSVATERTESNIGMIENNLLSLSYGQIVNKDINTNDGLLPESFETYQIVRRDDIIFRLTDLQNDKRSLRTAIVEEKGIITSAYTAAIPARIVPTYLNYLLRSYDVQKVFYSMGGGLRQSIKYADIKWLPTLMPPANEQSTIATFLDRETAKVDTLIAKQEKLIELLKEKRQAVISHVVTKGLNTNVKMKDSGVEWLGDVPEHWEVKPIKYLASCNDETLEENTEPESEIQYVDISSVDVTYGITKTEPMLFKSSPSRARRKVQDGDVIVSTVRTYLRAIARVNLPDSNLIVSTGFAVIRPRFGLLPRFAGYLLTASYFIEDVIARSTGVSYPAINASELVRIKVATPTESEQQQIATFLDRETTKIDTLIARAEQAIVLQKEHRTALISAAVTGKIDVRDFSRSAQ